METMEEAGPEAKAKSIKWQLFDSEKELVPQETQPCEDDDHTDSRLSEEDVVVLTPKSQAAASASEDPHCAATKISRTMASMDKAILHIENVLKDPYSKEAIGPKSNDSSAAVWKRLLKPKKVRPQEGKKPPRFPRGAPHRAVRAKHHARSQNQEDDDYDSDFEDMDAGELILHNEPQFSTREECRDDEISAGRAVEALLDQSKSLAMRRLDEIYRRRKVGDRLHCQLDPAILDCYRLRERVNRLSRGTRPHSARQEALADQEAIPPIKSTKTRPQSAPLRRRAAVTKRKKAPIVLKTKKPWRIGEIGVVQMNDTYVRVRVVELSNTSIRVEAFVGQPGFLHHHQERFFRIEPFRLRRSDEIEQIAAAAMRIQAFSRRCAAVRSTRKIREAKAAQRIQRLCRQRSKRKALKADRGHILALKIQAQQRGRLCRRQYRQRRYDWRREKLLDANLAANTALTALLEAERIARLRVEKRVSSLEEALRAEQARAKSDIEQVSDAHLAAQVSGTLLKVERDSALEDCDHHKKMATKAVNARRKVEAINRVKIEQLEVSLELEQMKHKSTIDELKRHLAVASAISPASPDTAVGFESPPAADFLQQCGNDDAVIEAFPLNTTSHDEEGSNIPTNTGTIREEESIDSNQKESYSEPTHIVPLPATSHSIAGGQLPTNLVALNEEISRENDQDDTEDQPTNAMTSCESSSNQIGLNPPNVVEKQQPAIVSDVSEAESLDSYQEERFISITENQTTDVTLHENSSHKEEPNSHDTANEHQSADIVALSDHSPSLANNHNEAGEYFSSVRALHRSSSQDGSEIHDTAEDQQVELPVNAVTLSKDTLSDYNQDEAQLLCAKSVTLHESKSHQEELDSHDIAEKQDSTNNADVKEEKSRDCNHAQSELQPTNSETLPQSSYDENESQSHDIAAEQQSAHTRREDSSVKSETEHNETSMSFSYETSASYNQEEVTNNERRRTSSNRTSREELSLSTVEGDDQREFHFDSIAEERQDGLPIDVFDARKESPEVAETHKAESYQKKEMEESPIFSHHTTTSYNQVTDTDISQRQTSSNRSSKEELSLSTVEDGDEDDYYEDDFC